MQIDLDLLNKLLCAANEDGLSISVTRSYLVQTRAPAEDQENIKEFIAGVVLAMKSMSQVAALGVCAQIQAAAKRMVVCEVEGYLDEGDFSSNFFYGLKECSNFSKEDVAATIICINAGHARICTKVPYIQLYDDRIEYETSPYAKSYYINAAANVWNEIVARLSRPIRSMSASPPCTI